MTLYPWFRPASLALRSVLLVLALPALLRAQSPEDCLASLAKVLSPASNKDAAGEAEQPARYLAAIVEEIRENRNAEALQALSALRAGPASRNDKAVAIIDDLSAQLRARTAEVETKREAALDEIARSAATKLFAGAKPQEFDNLLKRLGDLPPATQPYNNPSAQKAEMVRSFVSRCQDYVIQSAQDSSDQLSGVVNELVELASHLTVVPRSQLLNLQAETTARLAGRSTEAALRLEEMNKAVVAAVDSAKVAADLDPVLADLTKPLPGDGFRGAAANNAASQREVLRRFVRRWQDYFSQIEAGNVSAAQNALRELSNDSSAESFYPRSRILALLNGKATAPAAADADANGPLLPPDALSLATLDKFVHQLALRRAASGYRLDPGLEDLLNEAGRLRTAADQLKLGNPQPAIGVLRLQSSGPRTGDYAFALSRVQQTLVLQALPAYVQAPEELTPSSHDTPDTFLGRVINYGRERSDWQLAYRAIEAAQAINLGYSTSGMSADANGYRLFFAGMNQERGGQWTAAVRSYLSALRTTGENVPVEEIGHRLEKLKAAHPQDFASAEKASEYPEGFHNYLPPGLGAATNGALTTPGARSNIPPQSVPAQAPKKVATPATSTHRPETPATDANK